MDRKQYRNGDRLHILVMDGRAVLLFPERKRNCSQCCEDFLGYGCQQGLAGPVAKAGLFSCYFFSFFATGGEVKWYQVPRHHGAKTGESSRARY